MNTKRWLALVLAVALVFVSLGFRFTMNVVSGMFDNLMSFSPDFVEEHIIQDGDFDSKIAVLSLEGVIQDVEVSPFLSGYNHQSFLRSIKQAGEDPFVEAIVLKVNTPGGGVVESAQINRALVEMQEEYDKPIYVSMGNTAASGGYYVSAPADKIFAEAATLTGSIGVIMENINFTKLAEKYGVDFNTITSGEHKDIMSASREMTEEERAILQSMIDEMYDDFVQVIVDGRGMDEKAVRELADGRVYTGKQAKENNLVDEVGSFTDTLQALMVDYDLEDAQVVEYGDGINYLSIVGMSAVDFFQKGNSDIANLLNLLRQSDSPRAMYLYSM